MITHKILTELLEYNHCSGVFTWLKSPNKRIRVGSEAGSLNSDGYIRIIVNKKSYKAHRLAWLYVNGEFPHGDQPFIDHIDGDKSNNKISNLRPATRSENGKNRGKLSSNKSGYKGVSWYKPTGRWKVQARLEGKQFYLGLFDDLEEAATAYKNFAESHHAEFTKI